MYLQVCLDSEMNRNDFCPFYFLGTESWNLCVWDNDSGIDQESRDVPTVLALLREPQQKQLREGENLSFIGVKLVIPPLPPPPLAAPARGTQNSWLWLSSGMAKEVGGYLHCCRSSYILAIFGFVVFLSPLNYLMSGRLSSQMQNLLGVEVPRAMPDIEGVQLPRCFVSKRIINHPDHEPMVGWGRMERKQRTEMAPVWLVWQPWSGEGTAAVTVRSVFLFFL